MKIFRRSRPPTPAQTLVCAIVRFHLDLDPGVHRLLGHVCQDSRSLPLSTDDASKCQQSWTRFSLLYAVSAPAIARCSAWQLSAQTKTQTKTAATAFATRASSQLSVEWPPAAARRGLVQGSCPWGPCIRSVAADGGSSAAANCRGPSRKSIFTPYLHRYPSYRPPRT